MKLNRLTCISLEQLAHQLNPILRGWWNYYGAFYRTEMRKLFVYLNKRLATWASRDGDAGLVVQGKTFVPEITLSMFSTEKQPLRDFSVIFGAHYKPQASWHLDMQDLSWLAWS